MSGAEGPDQTNRFLVARDVSDLASVYSIHSAVV